MIDLEEYYDEYEYLYDEEPVRKKAKAPKEPDSSSKKKKKNFKRGTKQELWDEYLENSEEEDFGKEIMKDIKKEEKKTTEKKEAKKEEKKKSFDGPNSRMVKGVQINYDGVISLTRIENLYNGKKTFGIKYNFKSKDNGAFKVIWFSQNEFERDQVYAQEMKFWMSVKTKN